MINPFTLTPDEVDMVVDSLNERIVALFRYISWVDDQPKLPEKQVAHDRIRHEIREARRLAFRLKTGREL